MNDRLNKLMKEKDITPNRLAKMLDIQPSAVSHILSGRNRPGYSVIVKMLEAFPDINPRWLLYGSGNMYEADAKKVTATPVPLPVAEGNAAQKALFSEDLTEIFADAPRPSDSSSDEGSVAFAPYFGTDKETEITPRTPGRHSPGVTIASNSDAESKPTSLSESVNDESDSKIGTVQNTETFNIIGKSSRIKQIVLIYENNTFEILDQH